MTSLPDLYEARVQSGALSADPAQRAALPAFERLRSELTKTQKPRLFRRSPPPPKGLYLWGGVGRGKSMLMDLFAQSLTVPTRRVHFHAFMQEVQTELHRLRSQGMADPIKPVAKSVSDKIRVLAFDEMQITDIADAMIVGRLFEALMEAGTVIITTSNRPPHDLYKNGLNRALFLPFITLLETRLTVHELTSPHDHRQNHKQGAQVYFTPANAEARTSIDAIWQEQSQGNSAPLTLTIKGRDLTLPLYGNGAARTRFHDLCGQPLGPADYLAIAERLDMLILEDIPRLSRSNFNEAKRFVTLIDALYEARVRLIASAAALPEYLYIEGTGSFEFERTASRLREMQGHGWADGRAEK